jgi:DNA-directed RNA polymerase III subunit RPC1
VLTHLIVPPVAIRPSVPMDAGGGSNEDDLTVKLQEIIAMNTTLRVALSRATPPRMLMENWDFLQVSRRGGRSAGRS